MRRMTSGWVSPKYSGPAMAVLGGGGSGSPACLLRRHEQHIGRQLQAAKDCTIYGSTTAPRIFVRRYLAWEAYDKNDCSYLS